MSLSCEYSDDVCLCPLHTPAFNFLPIQWRIHECDLDGPTLRYVCCCLPTPGRPTLAFAPPVPDNTFIFELIGWISEEDCHLASEDHGESSNSPLASCWIQPCPDRVSCLEWSMGAQTLQHILTSIRDRWSDDILITEGDPLEVQLFYEPPEGKTLQETLPMYGRSGERFVPATLSDVLFGHPIRFLFTINYSHNLTVREGPSLVYAKLYSMKCL